MPVKRVPPDEAARLLEEGWTFLDVRSVAEFEQGHPSGAYNIPLLHAGPGGMSPNPDFANVVANTFGKDTRLVVGCKTGARSLRAATLLLDRGFTSIVDMQGGFGGEIADGVVVCEGWQARGLPVSEAAQAGHSFAELKD